MADLLNIDDSEGAPIVRTAQAVLGRHRRLLPRVDYDSILTNNGAPQEGEENHSFVAPRDTAVVYQSPEGLPGRLMLYVYCRSFSFEAATTDEKLSWMFTVLDLAIPGLAAHVAGTDVILERERLPEDVAALLTRPEDQGEITQEELQQAGLEAIRFAPYQADAPLVVRPIEDTAAGLAMLGLLLYAIAKTPNGVNDAGFSVNRPRGMAGTIGKASLPEEWVPSMDQYRAASAVFQMLPGPRQRLVRELCIWGKSSRRSWAQGVLVSQTRLWRGHGLTGLDMVRELLTNFGAVIETLPELAAAVLGFNEHEARYKAKAADPLRDYLNIIYADRSPLRGNGRYTLLVMIAKDFQARNAASMRSFGTTINAAYESRIREFAAGVNLSVPQYS